MVIVSNHKEWQHKKTSITFDKKGSHLIAANFSSTTTSLCQQKENERKKGKKLKFSQMENKE